ncbi:secreted periplasmic Zn-dependent protease [Cenarchaeum symbiosum A]|uniref:Secreted periplasmic Zn-dependent protease n=1 Tax=Cenarchaeum symbiosum (strain A) TaxID=414004 RepID=A0RYR6_CENSY|nr:secreted periplasmic Zn-dependent protease [Cenarchaeum symbiosum A]
MRALAAALLAAALCVAVPAAYGHGIGYEVLPPVPLGDRMVSLEVNSSQYENPDNPDREITFSLFNADNKITLRDVTYNVEASKGGRVLFDDTFLAPDGIFSFVLKGSDSEEITVSTEDRSDFFDFIKGQKKELVHLEGAPFRTGGLYSFRVLITTADSFSEELDPPVRFDVGLSVPQRTYHDVADPNYGAQQISVVTYYDEITGFEYDPGPREISFYMPFRWEAANINETYIVHEEIAFARSFGDLLAGGYVGTVNGLQVPERTITIDESRVDERIVHIIMDQLLLWDILYNQTEDTSGMRFSLQPAEGSGLSAVTDNREFRVWLDWEPADIKSGSETVFRFFITDVFLKDSPVSVEYELSLLSGEDVLASTSGTSSGSDKGEEFRVDMPPGISGPVTLSFEGLGGSSLGRAVLPVVVDRAESGGPAAVRIPEWVRGSAGWWAAGEITDGDFASGVQYLVDRGVLRIPPGDSGAEPGDIKNDAGRWAAGDITDGEFAGALRNLLSGMILGSAAPLG